MVLPTPEGLVAARRRMRAALDYADAHCPAGDVPVAALVEDERGRLIAAATNRREADGDPTAHAEVLALRAAAARLGDGWRLTGCTITVTLEPCAMCAGAIMAARLARVEFGAFEPKTGACGSRWDLLRDRASPLPAPEVRGGVLAEEAARPLRGFFSKTNNSGRFPG